MTKFQFERFLAEPNDYEDAWYARVLQVSPRPAARALTAGQREACFMAGVLPEEAAEFSAWLGRQRGFALPTVAQWRSLEQTLAALPVTRADRQQVANLRLAPAARMVHQCLWEVTPPTNWSEATLMRGGLLEWVSLREGYGALGKPRAEFYRNVYNPQTDPPLVPLGEPRSRYFGFRPVRRLVGGTGARS